MLTLISQECNSLCQKSWTKAFSLLFCGGHVQYMISCDRPGNNFTQPCVPKLEVVFSKMLLKAVSLSKESSMENILVHCKCLEGRI